MDSTAAVTWPAVAEKALGMLSGGAVALLLAGALVAWYLKGKKDQQNQQPAAQPAVPAAQHNNELDVAVIGQWIEEQKRTNERQDGQIGELQKIARGQERLNGAMIQALGLRGQDRGGFQPPNLDPLGDV